MDPRDTDATRLASLPRPDSPPGAGGEIRIGTVIAGRFTLVEEIGEGGMGSVWVAQQTEPLKRIVAIKFAKAGASSTSVLARFEQERQALALMDHPNIAQVYDAGLTAAGQPFFVMELVRGRTLTRYCDEARLTPRQRLDLFVPICQAVQHAHQKGVVHRDLKPSNILIAQVDGKPVPKVIDFGVAKAIEGSLLADSDATQFGMVVGTLEYMAPEQAGGQSADVDTRADVYSLGVILYELLTGQRPHDTRRLKEAAWTEMIRVIREEDPQTPSRRLATEETLPTLAAARQTEPAQLVSLLRGDLDWVVMKCLEKQRERRYETANALARDVERFLADEVVEARPPTTGYRLGKFLKRHRGAAAAAAAIATALIAGVAAFAWQATVAGRQRDLAEAARRSESEQRRVADQEKDRAMAASAAARKAEGEATQSRDQALVEKETARLAEADAMRSRNAAVASEKAAVASEAAAVAARTQAEQNAQLAGQQAALAVGTVQSLITQANEKLQGPGLYDIRLGLLEVALQNVDGVASAYLRGTSKEATALAAMVGIGDIYRQLGEPAKASQQFLKALEIAKERVTIKNGSDASRRNLALVYSSLGAVSQELNRDLKASLDYYQKSLALFEDIDQHPMLADSPMPKPLIRASLAQAYQLVGVYYFRVGQLPGGLPYYEKCYAIVRELAAAQPDDVVLQVSLTKAALAIGSTTLRMGDRTRGAAMLAEARQRAESLLTARPAEPRAKENLADVLFMIAETQGQAGDVRGARTNLQLGLTLYGELANAEPRNTYYQRDVAAAHYTLGTFDVLEQKTDDARAHFDEALKIRRELATMSKANDRLQVALALVQAQVGQVDAAMTIADRFAAGALVDPEQRLELARCYAIASRTLPASDAARAAALQARATDTIRAAVRDGYRDRFYLEAEPDFAPLRGREDFKALVAALPGAGGR
jgi:tetratricopeptide (TPR) repeat protein